jgi:hypothetical protein
MQTPIKARELETELARIELGNAIYKLSAFADKARQNYPKLAQIASELSSEISDKFDLIHAEIETNIECEYEDLSPEQEEFLGVLSEICENFNK